MMWELKDLFRQLKAGGIEMAIESFITFFGGLFLIYMIGCLL